MSRRLSELQEARTGARTGDRAGVCGLLGALLMFAGDALLFGHGVEPANFAAGARIGVRASLLGATHGQLMVSGVIGPLAAVLYLIGFRHVYAQARRGAPLRAAGVALGFAVMMVVGGAYHALWSPYGMVLQHAAGDAPGSGALLQAVTEFMRLMFTVAALFGFPAAALLFYLVLAGKTTYPRWTALINPGLLVALAPLLRAPAEHLPRPIGALLFGGSINIAFAIFFTVSLVTTHANRSRNRAGEVRKPGDR